MRTRCRLYDYVISRRGSVLLGDSGLGQFTDTALSWRLWGAISHEPAGDGTCSCVHEPPEKGFLKHKTACPVARRLMRNRPPKSALPQFPPSSASSSSSSSYHKPHRYHNPHRYLEEGVSAGCMRRVCKQQRDVHALDEARFRAWAGLPGGLRCCQTAKRAGDLN